MSHWTFKNVQKAQNVVIIYFNDTNQPLWGGTMSVTIPAADAQKLLTNLQALLHPGKRP